MDAEAMLAFVLELLSETSHRLGTREELRARLLEMATAERPEADRFEEEQRRRLQTRVSDLERQLAAARRNLAIEEDSGLREAIREEYTRIETELRQAKIELDQVREQPATEHGDAEQEVEAALALLDDIQRICDDPAARADVLPLLQQLGLRVGLSFVEGIKGKKRKVRRLAGGVVTFGDTLVPNYDGRGPAPTQTITQNNQRLRWNLLNETDRIVKSPTRKREPIGRRIANERAFRSKR